MTVQKCIYSRYLWVRRKGMLVFVSDVELYRVIYKLALIDYSQIEQFSNE